MRRLAAMVPAIVMTLLHGPPARGIDLHVGPSGNDAWSGRSPVARSGEEGPLATLDGARLAIRKLRAAGTEAAGPINVHVQAGDYCLEKTFELGADDSGTADAPVAYLGGGEARLIGGRRLPAAAFSPVTEPPILGILPPEARGRVMWVDLAKMGVRAPEPLPDAFRSPPVMPELFFNDRRMTLARWPNEGWATIARVIDSGPAEWRSHQSQASPVFEYAGDRPGRWLQARAVWLLGYWCFDWAEETIRVARIDPDRHCITLKSPHVYGLGGGNPAPRRYCAVNLLEELDSPAEYYLDRERGRMYFLPPASMENARIILSTLNEPIIRAADASNVVLRGFAIETCSGNGVEIKGGQNVRIESCRIRNTGQAGILVSGGRAHTIGHCEIHDTGTLAVSIEGGDRRTLTPCGHTVIDNEIYRPGRRKPTYAGHIHLGGVGVRVAHNLLRDGPHLAIILHGNDHLIEYNDVHDVATETDDCGAFYMGRNPSERGTTIRYNFWHDVGSRFTHGSCAVYFDDGAGGQNVVGNVFYRAAGGNFGAVFVHGGHDNTVENNVFFDCSRAIGAAPWDDKRWKDYVDAPLWQQVLLKDVDITRAPYTERYPELAGFMRPDGKPRLNRATRNVVVRCGDFIRGNWDERDNLVTDSDPGFADPARLDFRLRRDAGLLERAPGFEPIPFGKIGLVSRASRPGAPTTAPGH